MSEQTQQLAHAESGQQVAAPRPSRPPIIFGERGIVINSFDELVRFSQTVATSGIAPKGLEKPEAIFVAVQMGLEVGLTPMASLQNVAVVNGRPTIWGDAQLAVCRSTGELEIFEEWFEVDGQKSLRNPTEYKDGTMAICHVKRVGQPATETAFSVADAKKAGLWGKAGPWSQYPFRMLKARARSYALRDSFGDALKGFRSAEEARDDEQRDVTPAATNAAQQSRLYNAPALPESTTQAPVPAAVPSSTAVAEALKGSKTGRSVKRTPADSAQAGETASLLPSGSEEKAVPISWPTLPDVIASKCEKDGVTWEQVNQIFIRNQLTTDMYPAPKDAPFELLQQADRMWPQILKLTKGGTEA